MSKIKRVCVFASSSNFLTECYYNDAAELGRLLGLNGYDIVYGGSTLGMMWACAEQVKANGGKIFGVMPKKLAEMGCRTDNCDEFHLADGMRDRKGKMDEISDAVIALAGGFGTLEELAEMIVQKQEASKMQVSSEVIERENWYSFFEEGLLQSFDKNGPAESIEEQLAFLYLENQEQLCIKNCGSAEEFLKHTNKIGFSPFGVETRIWRDGEDVPYIGEWNKNYTKDILMTELSVNFIPPVIDAFLEDYIYREKSRSKMEPLSDLLLKIFPEELNMTENERQLVLLNIEKRRDILLKDYNQFSDHPVAEVRRNAIKLFSEVSSLLCSIGCSGIDVQEFPQQELIILTQLYNHIAKLLEEVETKYLRTSFPKEDVELSLEGMKDTFEDISGSLICSLKNNKYKGFELLK